MKISVVFLICLITLISCSPVRTTTKVKIEKNKKDTEIVEKTYVNEDQRFNDTTLIVLQDVKAERPNGFNTSDISDSFTKAVTEFKTGDYDKACPKFDIYSQTFLPGDSLLYEAIFYDCECKIIENNIIDAKIILEEMITDEEITPIIEQKALTRLGQIECVSGNPDNAQIFFDELKNKYPDSKYNKIANCESVE